MIRLSQLLLKYINGITLKQMSSSQVFTCCPDFFFKQEGLSEGKHALLLLHVEQVWLRCGTFAIGESAAQLLRLVSCYLYHIRGQELVTALWGSINTIITWYSCSVGMLGVTRQVAVKGKLTKGSVKSTRSLTLLDGTLQKDKMDTF